MIFFEIIFFDLILHSSFSAFKRELSFKNKKFNANIKVSIFVFQINKGRTSVTYLKEIMSGFPFPAFVFLSL